MEATRPTSDHTHGTHTARRQRRAGVRMASAIVFAVVLAALAYWRLDPAALAREAFRACAGDAASALHDPDARRREQALNTLTDCAAQR
jgi:hypothetical protein